MRSLILLLALLMAAPASADEATATNAEETVVLKDSAALNNADLDALLAVLAPSLQIYKPPGEAHALVGPLSEKIGTYAQVRDHFREAFKQPQGRHEVVEMVSLGDIVLAQVEFQRPGDTAPYQMLTGFRVRNDRIEAIWHIARTEQPAPRDSGAAAQAVIHRFNRAADRNDVDAFLALFAPDARNFHFRNAPDTFGGGPSKSITDAASRERVFRKMFAEQPARIEELEIIAVGEWVVSHDRATRKDGIASEGLSIYRVQDGRIVDDWYVAARELPPAANKTSAAPEDVAQAFVAAWNRGDVEGVLGLFAEDGRVHQRSSDPRTLSGAVSDAIGTKAQLAAYLKEEFAKASRPRERILGVASAGDLVIASGESAGSRDRDPAHRFLTGYRVRSGLIHDVWHIAWLPRDVTSAVDAGNGAAQVASVAREGR